MRMLNRAAVTAALLVPIFAGPVTAQNYRWDLGVNGGYSWYSNMLDREAAGLTDSDDHLRFESDWLTGAQLGVWLTPKIGLRLNGTYADRPLSMDDTPQDLELVSSVNLWSGSADLMWRFRQPNTTWMGTEVLPYLALGLGAKWINPSGDAFTCIDPDGGDESCAPFTITDPTAGAVTFALPEQTRLMGLVGLGTDVRLAPRFAVRLEVNDRIYKPELYEADGTGTYTGESVGNTVHEIAGQVGLHLLMGLARPQVVSVAPAPAPPPAPPVAPQPPPMPVEEAVTVCVVDPTVRSGLRMQNALYRPETRDTVVLMSGRRVPLRDAVGSVMVVRDADWYVRGQPLVLRVNNERYEYLTYQGARRIEAANLAYLGTIDGYPVYADRDEVADLVDTLADARAATANSDLGSLLATRRDLRTRVNDVDYLYVPLEPTGCVFQALQPMAPVTKGK